MKIYVIAKKWDSEKQEQVKYIAGEFTSPINAFIFRDAYNERYKANAFCITEEHLIAGDAIGF